MYAILSAGSINESKKILVKVRGIPVMNELLDQFLHTADPEFKSIVERVDDAIASSGCALATGIKWGQLTYAKDADFHHWICAIKITRKFVGLTFHFGGLLEDSEGIFIAGSSKFARKIEYRRIDEVNEGVIRGFVKQAVDKLEYFKSNWREIQKGD
jgi:hypothetical protein